MEIINGLPIGAIIHGKLSDYRITSYRSQDGFGILYEATTVVPGGKKRQAETHVMIREFFMNRCSGRADDGCTVCTPEDIAPTVNNFYQSFVVASKRCADATDGIPGVINVIEIVNQNATSYYVVEQLEGETLEEYINREGPRNIHEARAMLKPIFDAVRHLHACQVMHTDIYPRHIRFTKSGDKKIAVLFSLYASKHFDDSGVPICVAPILVCRDGYAPPEQYTVMENFLPQIDIYALASVLVFVLSGKHLPDSRTLTEKDIRTTLPATLPETLVGTLIHALQPDYSSRPGSMSSFMDELLEFFETNEQYTPMDERKHSLHSSSDHDGNDRQGIFSKVASLFRKDKK